ncbi:conserved hypothetical protein [Frankia sp. AiPs1]|uniref:hypothetical protein n=1 Tax=Frankia sp. AiPa1 TaxID=573492 RepID=UPI00202B5D13|nr:hypothetical protein [Frankia sp. AiPa1]MCL9757789.1 hypothetical protein [Frankia sp. AiPa1]
MTELDGEDQTGHSTPGHAGPDSPDLATRQSNGPTGHRPGTTGITSPRGAAGSPGSAGRNASPPGASPGSSAAGPGASPGQATTSGPDLHGRYVTYDGWTPPSDDPLFGGPRSYAFSFDHLSPATSPDQPITSAPSASGSAAGEHPASMGPAPSPGASTAASGAPAAGPDGPSTDPGWPTGPGRLADTSWGAEDEHEWPGRYERPAARAAGPWGGAASDGGAVPDGGTASGPRLDDGYRPGATETAQPGTTAWTTPRGDAAPVPPLRATRDTAPGYPGFDTARFSGGGFGPNDGSGQHDDLGRDDGYGHDSHEADDQEPGRSPRAWRVLLTVAGAVLVLVAAIAAVALRSNGNGASPQPGTAATAGTIAPIPANFLDSVTTDADPIRTGEFFTDTSVERNGHQYRRLAGRLDHGCPQLTSELAKLFTSSNCLQVVRSLYLSTPTAGARQVLAGVTVFRLDTSATATRGAQALSFGVGGIAPLPIPAGALSGPHVASPGGNNSWRVAQARGHYLVFTQVAYVDGTAGAATDPALKAAQTDLAQLAAEPIGDRAVLGHGPRH